MRSVLTIARKYIHSFVTFTSDPDPSQWSYVLRFSPDGASDMIAIHPEGHPLYGKSYQQLIRTIMVMLECNEQRAIFLLVQTAALLDHTIPIEEIPFSD